MALGAENRLVEVQRNAVNFALVAAVVDINFANVILVDVR